MIQAKQNKCKGSGKALGYGCSKIDFRYKFGLCRTCFFDWLNNTEQGNNFRPTLIKSALNKVKKSKPKRKYIKWEEKPTNEMIIYVQENIVNPYIRLRDIENGYRCISSGGVVEHAGHCFSVGSTPGLRFCVSNIHGQQHAANVHKHGDFDNYRLGLIERFGNSYFEELSRLKMRAEKFRNLDRLEVIRVGKTYEYLTKKRMWVFQHKVFENYKNILNK